jgi:hypothetical protein
VAYDRTTKERGGELVGGVSSEKRRPAAPECAEPLSKRSVALAIAAVKMIALFLAERSTSPFKVDRHPLLKGISKADY